MSAVRDLCFVDEDGRRWQAIDAAVIRGRYVVLPTGSERAERRLFISSDGQSRSYSFRARDSHAATAPRLLRQLEASTGLEEGGLDPAVVITMPCA